MWRMVDLHRHTFGHGSNTAAPDAQAFVERCLEDNLAVVSVTDHDTIENVEAVIGAAISTGLEVIDLIVLVGAHVDQSSSLLGTSQPASVSRQIEAARQLHGLELVSSDIRREWLKSGVKQKDFFPALIQGSDAHPGLSYERRFTWLFLEDISARCLFHALATHESSIRIGDRPDETMCWIKSVRFSGGIHAGKTFTFSPRTNAIIGPPNSGKSVLIDAMRFALGSECGIREVAMNSEARLANALGVGTEVRMELVIEGKVIEVSRVWGGAAPMEAPLAPVAFSQMELVRRSMQPSPSIDLLDIHCEPAVELKSELSRCESRVQPAFRDLVENATNAGVLTARLENPQDGIEATRAELEKLQGDEPLAQLATQLDRVNRWRRSTREQVLQWKANLQPPPGPGVQTAPTLDEGSGLSSYVPRGRIQEILDSFDSRVHAAATDAANAIHGILESSEKEFAERQAIVEEKMMEGEVTQPSSISDRLAGLRGKLAELEQQQAELEALNAQVAVGIDALKELSQLAASIRSALTDVRKRTCNSINQSMPSFIAFLDPCGNPDQIDGLLHGIKQGTYLRSDSVPRLRNELDRQKIINDSVSAARRIGAGNDEVRTDQTDQDKLVSECIRRQRLLDIGRLTVLWPDDSLRLRYRGGPGQPQEFNTLTEGLRALGIKEVSFALSDVPVISDQPEDAVPTAAVFESLVLQTLRVQRAVRQFIVASHDANVVVGGDVEQVIVLDAQGDGSHAEGTLFDPGIRQHALQLLEGGQQAFAIRRERYGRIGEH